ncbi:hypothetical protein [Micromonospora parathelypteridis]|uniref:Secreted protein n=1 Tax=Micromonospora parathelypteridis TaxID=1839617 RepID=A0A840WFJ9_9ACTN|nr:hypothetical protein [Micromonospora parathelypteridis]MBB5481791.1 hypothetical protein [Micromonospora parathelypteridis]GGO28166.1 hypothetical protein GCM10011576_53460 [Micromonospora parathelypteridis]
MTNRLIRRVSAVALAAVLGGGAALAGASPAQASGCYTGTGTVASPKGGAGATARATLCVNSAGYAWLDTNSTNTVTDRQADGYAARVYVYWAQQYSGAIAVDDTSNSGSVPLYWESNRGTPYLWTEVYVCMGFSRPDDYNGRCASVVYGS